MTKLKYMMASETGGVADGRQADAEEVASYMKEERPDLRVYVVEVKAKLERRRGRFRTYRTYRTYGAAWCRGCGKYGKKSSAAPLAYIYARCGEKCGRIYWRCGDQFAGDA